MKHTGEEMMLLGVEEIVQVPASKVGWNAGNAAGRYVFPGIFFPVRIVTGVPAGPVDRGVSVIGLTKVTLTNPLTLNVVWALGNVGGNGCEVVSVTTRV
jgi:hypothetical protein